MKGVLLTQDQGKILGPIAKLLGYLMNAIFNALNSIGIVEVGSALGSNQSESKVLQSLTDKEYLIFLAFLVAQADKYLFVFPGSRCVWEF